MRFKGKPVIGLGVVMAPAATCRRSARRSTGDGRGRGDLPVGITVHRVANQPEVVDEVVRASSSHSLLEALAIVLVVSFISLGLRTGIIVAISVPLVLAITFVGMMLLGIDFQRISLGALIIALGLLVDDAIIAVEMMMVKLEQGCEPARGGDLRLHLDRLPDADRHAGHGGRLRAGRLRQVERRRIHQLDLLGGRPLAGHLAGSWPCCSRPGWATTCCRRPRSHHHDPYDGRLYTALPQLVVWCVTWRKTTIAITALAFVAAHGRLHAWCRSSSSRPPTGPS